MWRLTLQTVLTRQLWYFKCIRLFDIRFACRYINVVVLWKDAFQSKLSSPAQPSWHLFHMKCHYYPIFILSLSECVIKCFKFRCIWMLCRSWTMIKCVWEVPVWCYQLFAAWQRSIKNRHCFLCGFEQWALRKDLKLTTMLAVEANTPINYHAAATE